MKLDLMFDLLCHMREHAKEDFVLDKKRGIVLNYRQQGYVLHKSIQAFVHEVASREKDRAIQAFSGSSDLPVLTKDVFNVFQPVETYDTFWQEAFRGVPLRRGQLSWEIADVASGVVFEMIPEGGKVKFYGITGSKVDAKIDKYGAGIGLTWEMIEGRKLYQFVDIMLAVRAKLNLLWADTHYGLLATAAATNPVIYQGVVTDPVIDRDVATINKAYETIGEATKDSGYGDTANAPMLLYASPKLKARINMAMRVTAPDIAAGRPGGAAGSRAGQIVEYNVQPRFTWNSSVPVDKAIMALPGQKVQNSVYMQELGLSEQDIATLSELRTYWTAFGAIVADTNQTAEVAFADAGT